MRTTGRLWAAVLAIVLSAALSSVCAVDESVVPPFVPTADWQPILPGQSIPPGLDVYMDLQTGEKRARLLPREDASASTTLPQRDSSKELSVVPGGKNQESQQRATGAISPPPKGRDKEEKDQMTDKEREQVLRHWGKMLQKLHGASNVETMRQALGVLANPASAASAVDDAMQLLEDIVHSVDDAKDFISIGGVGAILAHLQGPRVLLNGSMPFFPFGSSGDDSLDFGTWTTATERVTTLWRGVWVLGTLVQNLHQAQDNTLAQGVQELFVSLLSQALTSLKNLRKSSPSSSSLAQAHRKQVVFLVGKLLYASGTLMRSNSDAEQRFWRNGGLALLRGLLEETSTDVRFVSSAVTRKAMGVVMDFLADAVVNRGDNVSCTECIRELQSPEWCALVPKFISVGSPLLVETSLQTLHLLAQLPTTETEASVGCREALSSADVKAALRVIQQRGRASGDEWEQDLGSLATTILGLL